MFLSRPPATSSEMKITTFMCTIALLIAGAAAQQSTEGPQFTTDVPSPSTYVSLDEF